MAGVEKRLLSKILRPYAHLKGKKGVERGNPH